MRKQGNGQSPRLGRNGLSPRKGRNGPSPRKGNAQSPSKGSSSAVQFWNDVLESQADDSLENPLEKSPASSPGKNEVSSETRDVASSPAARPSLQPLLEMLDDVHFSDSEEMMEDEYLVVQPYELDSNEEVEIAPGKDDIQLEVEGDYVYGEISHGLRYYHCRRRSCRHFYCLGATAPGLYHR